MWPQSTGNGASTAKSSWLAALTLTKTCFHFLLTCLLEEQAERSLARFSSGEGGCCVCECCAPFIKEKVFTACIYPQDELNIDSQPQAMQVDPIRPNIFPSLDGMENYDQKFSLFSENSSFIALDFPETLFMSSPREPFGSLPYSSCECASSARYISSDTDDILQLWT